MKIQPVLLGLILVLQIHAKECNTVQYNSSSKSETSIESYTSKESLFSLSIPQGWLKNENNLEYANSEIKPVGINLKGEADEVWVKPEILAVYYENGTLFSDYRDYVRLKRKTFNPQYNDSNATFSEVSAGGKKGIGFELRSVVFTDNSSLFEEGIMYRLSSENIPKAVDVIEYYRIFPAQHGFFVFRYKASAKNADKCLGVFERLLQSVRFENSNPWKEQNR